MPEIYVRADIFIEQIQIRTGADNNCYWNELIAVCIEKCNEM